MACFALSTDPFRSFSTWRGAYTHVTAGQASKTVWAVVQFDDVPIYSVVTSQALQGANASSIHAEENVIMGFTTFLCRATIKAGKLLRACNIYLSDSPSTCNDARPSNHIQGMPFSCTSKFQVLARSFPALQFHVFFAGTYGYLDEVTSSKHMGKTIGGLMDRLSPIFKGEKLNSTQLALLGSVLQDFHPDLNIGPAETLEVVNQLRKLAQNRVMQDTPDKSDKKVAQMIASAIDKALGKSSFSREGVSDSIMGRASSSSEEVAPVVNVANLTIQSRNFATDPPNP